MNNLTKILSTTVLSFGLLFGATMASSATFIGPTVIVTDSNLYENSPTSPYSGIIHTVSNGGDYVWAGSVAPIEAYILDANPPPAVNQEHLQVALDDAGSLYTVESFVSSDDAWFSGTLVDNGTSGTYYLSQGFTGFMIKASTLTFVALFDEVVQSIDWNTNWVVNGQGIPHAMSHVGVLNAVPVPAALWLFAPALLGLMGFRRRNNKV